MRGSTVSGSRPAALGAILAIVAALLVAPPSVPVARATDHTVGAGQTYETIADALADTGSVLAGDGGSVLTPSS